MTGERRFTIDYRRDGLRHAQNMAVGKFDKDLPGLQIALCGKRSELAMWDSQGKLMWQRGVPTSLLSKGDFNGDGAEEIMVFGLGANVDGIFSVWNGRGERLYAVSFLPSPSRRTWSDKHNGGSWSHAMPGGHEGIRRQVDLDGNGRADVIMPFGACHWGSDSILFLMEGPTPETAGEKSTRTTANQRVSGVNLALDGTAAASSIYSSTHEAAKAFDGDESTRWGAERRSTAPEWLEIAFDTPKTFNTVVIKEFNEKIISHTVQCDRDGTWIDLAEGFRIGPQGKIHRFDEVTSSKVRLDIGGTASEPTIKEFGVYHSTSDD